MDRDGDLYRRLLVATLLRRDGRRIRLTAHELRAADGLRLVIDRDQDGRVTVEVRERERADGAG